MRQQEDHFKGKIVWITGASSGIGEAMAYQLAARGARLVLSSNEPEGLERVKGQCPDPTDHLIVPLDLAESATLAEKARTVLDRFDRVDILINNGGISHRSLAKDTILEVDRRIMEVDYFGHVALTKAVLPSMLKQRSGHIVVTTSLAGLIPLPLRSAYCAAKHALHGFFDTLRAELWNEGIRVTLVCPGPVRTNISWNALNGDGSRYGKMDPMIASGIPPEACAEAILKAVAKGKRQVLVGKGSPILGVYIDRYFPALFAHLIRRAKVV